MSVSLKKGQKISLSKEKAGLKKVMVGLGWDEAPRSGGGFLGLRRPQPIDCDASAFILTDGKLKENADIVYYGNLNHSSGCVIHMGDNLTGEGEGDDEQIALALDRLPEKYDKIVVVVNIYEASKRNQHFGMIRNAFIRIVDADTNKELCRFNLTDDYSNMTAMVFGEIYRHNGEWKFNAVGQGTHDGKIAELAQKYY